MLQGPKETIRRARRLRREMSLPEVLLWQELRKRPAGLKFRKQHPAGPYAADFFCHAARLVIEVDGEAHGRGDRPRRDDARDAWFAERRFAMMRIPAQEVLGNLEGVIQGIVARANGKNPPPSGEDL
jgi:very-short-patch-repair endonuclease